MVVYLRSSRRCNHYIAIDAKSSRGIDKAPIKERTRIATNESGYIIVLRERLLLILPVRYGVPHGWE